MLKDKLTITTGTFRVGFGHGVNYGYYKVTDWMENEMKFHHNPRRQFGCKLHVDNQTVHYISNWRLV